MSYPFSDIADYLEESIFEPDVSWTGGDLHVTELGSSLDAFAQLNEPVSKQRKPSESRAGLSSGD